MTKSERRARIRRRVRVRKRGQQIASGVGRDEYSVWGETPDAYAQTVHVDDTKP